MPNEQDSTLQGGGERRSLLRQGIMRLRRLLLPSSQGLRVGDNFITAKDDGSGNIDPYWQRADGTESNISDTGGASDVATHAAIADAHHTAYTDALAIAAVEGEATLNLAGLIKFLLNDAVIKTDGEYIRAQTAAGLLSIDVRSGLIINLDANSNESNAAVTIRHNATTTDMIRLNEDGTIDVDVINEVNPDIGVTVDGVLLKDNFIASSAVPDGADATALHKWESYIPFGSEPPLGQSIIP